MWTRRGTRRPLDETRALRSALPAEGARGRRATGFARSTPDKEASVPLAASTVAIVAIAAVVIVALIALIYIVPRGGRRRR
jgi:hypothetical protein